MSHVDPNRVRESLRDMAGDLTVKPRMLSGAYRVLRLAGVLTVDEHTVNTDTHGGNAGKWLNTFCADLAPTGAHPNPTVYLMECAP